MTLQASKRTSRQAANCIQQPPSAACLKLAFLGGAANKQENTKRDQICEKTHQSAWIMPVVSKQNVSIHDSRCSQQGINSLLQTMGTSFVKALPYGCSLTREVPTAERTCTLSLLVNI
jgi:hypothetical protein